jgi:UDP-GlcNAc:undecaprenyl-phosphate GlcNAc-1-phosphate transferase
VHAAFAAPAAAAFTALCWLVNRQLFGFLPNDLPRPGRKQHARPVPLAGIALLPMLWPWLGAGGHWWLLLGTGAVAWLGFADDWRKERGGDLDWRVKALVLMLGAALAANDAVDAFAEPGRFALAMALAFVLANATNFLDNTDGVATALSAVSLLSASGGDGALAAAGFAALGFLPWNWPRPVLFLGDAGAYMLGLCGGDLLAQRLPQGLPALLPFAVQFADFAQVVTARLVLGTPPWVGDRRHLTHVLQNLGLPRALTAPAFAIAAALLAGAAA